MAHSFSLWGCALYYPRADLLESMALGVRYTGSSSYKVTALLSVRSEATEGDDGGSVGSKGWGFEGVMRTWS